MILFSCMHMSNSFKCDICFLSLQVKTIQGYLTESTVYFPKLLSCIYTFNFFQSKLLIINPFFKSKSTLCFLLLNQYMFLLLLFKPLKCEICSAILIQVIKFKYHLINHPGKKPFQSDLYLLHHQANTP